MEAGYNIQWKQKDIIRNKADGHPFLVVTVHKEVCTVIVDLLDTSDLPPTRVLLSRQYDNYVLDQLYD